MALADNKKKLELQIGANTKPLEKQLDDLKGKIKDLMQVRSTKQRGDALEALELQAKAGIKPLEDLRRALAETIGQAKLANKVSPSPVNDIAIAKSVIRLKEIQAQVQKTKQVMEQTPKVDLLGNLELQAKAGIISLTQLRDEIVKTVRARLANKANRSDFVNDPEILRAIVRLKQLRQEIDGVSPAVETMQGKLTRIGAALQQAFLPLAGISASITALLGVSAKSFADFERTLNTIRAVSGVTVSDLEKIKQNSLDLGQSTIFNNQQVAESYLELSKAGFTAQEATEALPALLNLAAAAGGRLDVATQAVSEGMRAFGLETSRTGEFTDVLAQAANQSSADIDDLAFAFKQIAPLARQTGQSVQDVSALLAILANNSVKGADAGSDLRNIITRLVKPSKETADAMKQLNVSLRDQQGNVKPLSQFFKELGVSLSKYNDSSKAAAASALAGQENLKTLLILASQAPQSIEAMVASMNNATGATQRMADTINQGLFSSLEQLSGAFDTLKTTLGEALAPAIRTVADLLTKVTTALTQNKAVTQFAAGFLAAVAGVTALSAAVGGLLLALVPLGITLAALNLSIPGMILALGGFAAAAGVVTLAVNSLSQSQRLANLSASDLCQEIDNTAAAAIKATEADQKLARNLDDVRKKTTLTVEEKKKLVQQFDELRKRFPQLNGSIDELAAKYGSLEKAIKAARIQQAAFAIGKDIDQRLSDIDQEIRARESFSKRHSNLFTTITPQDRKAEQDAINALKQRRKEAVDERENLSQRLIQMFKSEGEAKSSVTNSKGTQNFQATTSNKTKREAEKTAKAQQDLNEELKRLEAELTGFYQGEFAKRKAIIENTFQAEIRKIEELRKTAHLSSAAVQDLTNKARALRDEQKQEVDKEQGRTLRENQRLLASLQADVQSLQASVTQGNPFDDMEADVKKAATAIDVQYSEALEKLTVLQEQQLIPQDTLEKLKAVYKARQDAELAQLKQTSEERLRQEQSAFQELKAQNDVLAAELTGDQIKIIQANYKKLQASISREVALIQDKLSQVNADLVKAPNDKNLLRAQGILTEQLQAKSQESTLATQRQAREESAATSEGIQQVVAQLQQEIDLYGRRPELVQKLLIAYDEYLKALEKERNLTNQTAENRARIDGLLQETRAASVRLQTSTDTTGRAIEALQSVNLGSGEFSSLFKNLLSGFAQLRTAFKTFGSDTKNAGKGFKDFLAGNQDAKSSLAALGSQAAQVVGDYFSKGKSGLSKSIGGTLSAVFSGLSSGPAAPFALALNSASQAIQSSGGFFTKYMRFIDPLGFRKLFGVDTKSAIQKAQENLENTQKFMQNILAKTDQNDLINLTKALNQINKYTSGGGQAFQVKRDAANQIKAAIKNRKQVIDEALKDLQFQNAAIQKELTKFDDQPIENLNIDRSLQLDQLTYERDKALEQFKDSLAVQQQIQANFELKRQAILKQSSLDIIDVVINEQNSIRELRAQDAVNQAQVSGNAIQQINAELQARLVAIDNDIASFKGAEETKTEFLKAKASERNSIIKDANDQVDNLLQQGLEILNEGLVVGETKAQSQQKRLQKLFGSLNPLGLIQADGSLVQSNVTVGAGAIQMVFEGIQDVQSLIAQLTDPIIQNKLLAALNAALART